MSSNQSVDRAVTVLWILNGLQQATVTEIAAELDVHKSTASRLLAVLEQHQLVVRQPGSMAYELGHGILQLASTVRSQNDLTRSAQLLVEMVAEHFKLTANVAILDEIFAVNIAQSAPSEKFFTPPPICRTQNTGPCHQQWQSVIGLRREGRPRPSAGHRT